MASSANALLVRWNGGYTSVVDAASIAVHGRREQLLTLGAVHDRALAVQVAQAVLAQYANPTVGIAAGLESVGGDEPYVDFTVGDLILAPDETGAIVQVRTVGVTVTEDEIGAVSYTPELGTLRQEVGVRLQRWLQKLGPGTLDGAVTVGSPPAPIASPTYGAGGFGSFLDGATPPTTPEEPTNTLTNPTFYGMVSAAAATNVNFGTTPTQTAGPVDVSGGVDYAAGSTQTMEPGSLETVYGQTVYGVAPTGEAGTLETGEHAADPEQPGVVLVGDGKTSIRVGPTPDEIAGYASIYWSWLNGGVMEVAHLDGNKSYWGLLEASAQYPLDTGFAYGINIPNDTKKFAVHVGGKKKLELATNSIKLDAPSGTGVTTVAALHVDSQGNVYTKSTTGGAGGGGAEEAVFSQDGALVTSESNYWSPGSALTISTIVVMWRDPGVSVAAGPSTILIKKNDVTEATLVASPVGKREVFGVSISLAPTDLLSVALSTIRVSASGLTVIARP